MKKRLQLALILVTIVSTISGCAIYRRPTPNVPGPTAPAPAPMIPASSDRIMQLVNSIDGVKGSYTVVVGSMALIGVDLKDKLTGDQENKLKTTISERVKQQYSNLTEVWVSADPDLVVRIRTLASKIGRGEPLSGMMNEINELLKKLQPRSS